MKHKFYTTGRYGFEEIDIWRLDRDFHSGPECMRCGEIFCMYYEPDRMYGECLSGQLDIFEHGGIT